MTSDPIARYLATRGNLIDRQVQLRARPTGELLDETFRVYRRHGFLLLRLTAVPAFFVFASIVFVVAYVLPSLATSTSSDVQRQVGETAVNLLVGLFVAGPLAVLGTSVVSATVTSVIAQFLVKGEIDLLAASKEARASLPTLIRNLFRTLFTSVSGVAAASALMLLGGILSTVTSKDSVSAGIVASIGIFGLSIGGFIFLRVVAMHSLVPAISVLENLKGKEATKRSMSLFRGSVRHPHGGEMIWSLYMLLLILGAALIGGTYSIPLLFNFAEHLDGWMGPGPLKQLILESFLYLPAYLVVWLLLPTWATGTTLLYFDRRIRLEGYDIDLLGQEVTRTTKKGRFHA